MTPEQAAAYVQAQSVAAQAEINGMAAENTHASMIGNSIPYGLAEFLKVIEEYGLHHNTIETLFRGANQT